MNLDKLFDLAIRHRNIFVILFGLLLFVAFAGLRDVWYPDEPDIAEVALAMYLSGDWISPRRMGVVWVDYPPMIYWIGNISAHLFDSMNAFTLRLPNGLVAIAIVLITGATAARWFDARTGFWAAFALMTCGGPKAPTPLVFSCQPCEGAILVQQPTAVNWVRTIVACSIELSPRGIQGGWIPLRR